jgi:hypothetical protein
VEVGRERKRGKDMKSIKKVLALALALAMVVTAVPVTNAEAATTGVAKTKTYYVGKSYTLKLTTPSSWKSVKTTWTTSKKSVAKLASKKNKSVKVTAVKAGSATVKAQVTYKKSSKKATKTYTCAVTVKDPSVTLTGADTVLIGATETLTATVKPAKVKATFKSLNEDIATVDENGVVTGVKAGVATITATAEVGTNTVTTDKQVTVKNDITEFTAVTPKKLNVKFAGELTSITKDNFTLVDAKGTKVAIQKVTLSDDKKNVSVEVYSDLTTATEYTVTAKIDDVTFTKSLNFVKGAVAKIEASNQTVEAGSAQQIKYTVYDENGLDITDSTTVTFTSNVVLTDATKGTINLANGVLAYVTITYVNPTTGTEIKSETFTVTGATSKASSITAITIGDAAVSTASAWPSTVTTSVAKGSSKVVSVLYEDQYGTKKVTSTGFESLDPSVFIVDAASGQITTVAEGSGQLKVSVDGVSQTFTITVTAASYAASIAVDSSSVVKASKTNASVNTASVKVNVLDQNGKSYNSDSSSNSLTFELTSGAGVLAEASTVGAKVYATAGTAKTFTAANAGTAIFKVTSNKAGLNYVMVTITVYDTNDTIVGYSLVGVKNLDIQDAYDDDSDTNDYKTTISLNPVNSDGFVVSTTDGIDKVTITVTKPDKSTTPISNGATIDTTTAGSQFSSEGTYSIVAARDGVTVATASFTVKDSGVAPVVTINKNEVAYSAVYADFTTNFTVSDTAYSVTGVKFISGNEAVIKSTGDTPTTTLAGLSSTSTDVTLYNVVVIIDNATTGRTFSVSTNQQIKVTGVSK